jgi:hypothetical protein
MEPGIQPRTPEQFEQLKAQVAEVNADVIEEELSRVGNRVAGLVAKSQGQLKFNKHKREQVFLHSQDTSVGAVVETSDQAYLVGPTGAWHRI